MILHAVKAIEKAAYVRCLQFIVVTLGKGLEEIWGRHKLNAHRYKGYRPPMTARSLRTRQSVGAPN